MMKDKKNAYTLGYSDPLLALLNRRNVDNSAGFVKAYLKPDASILDCGCGPGSITAGFALMVPNGSVIGVDVESMQFSEAKALANKLSLKNVSYQEADICQLPFADNTFDVVYANATLSHIPSFKKAIEEMIRVTKVNGVVAVRDIDLDSLILHSSSDEVYIAYLIRNKILLNSHVNIYIGKSLKSLLYQSGCSSVIATTTLDTYGHADAIKEIGRYLSGEIHQFTVKHDLLNKNLLTEQEVSLYERAWLYFSQDPEAFLSSIWVEAVGIKN
jgi:ubiquinone/menaquinone biosynthesis C-methylase UbiE